MTKFQGIFISPKLILSADDDKQGPFTCVAITASKNGSQLVWGSPVQYLASSSLKPPADWLLCLLWNGRKLNAGRRNVDWSPPNRLSPVTFCGGERCFYCAAAVQCREYQRKWQSFCDALWSPTNLRKSGERIPGRGHAVLCLDRLSSLLIFGSMGCYSIWFWNKIIALCQLSYDHSNESWAQTMG